MPPDARSEAQGKLVGFLERKAFQPVLDAAAARDRLEKERTRGKVVLELAQR